VSTEPGAAQFVEFLDEIVDEETKKQVRTTLVKDKQLPDTSFKALDDRFRETDHIGC
jgi:hypothetical protein